MVDTDMPFYRRFPIKFRIKKRLSCADWSNELPAVGNQHPVRKQPDSLERAEIRRGLTLLTVLEFSHDVTAYES